MARQRTHEETRAYMRHLCAIIAAGRPAVRPMTAAEEADRAIGRALISVQSGADFGYMTGARLDDYRRIQALRDALASARALGLDDLGARTAQAVDMARGIAEPWRGRWE
ncbi:MAG: hypothetical protein ABFC89_06450 [Methanospirillum sp.]